MKNFENYFKKEKWTNPVRSSCGTSNSARIILGPNPAAGQRSIISDGAKTLLWVGILLLISVPSYAGSLGEVSQNIEQLKLIEPPFQFALIGDSRDGEEVYVRLMGRALERKPHFFIHLGDMIAHPEEKEWQKFFEISKPIDIPFFPVVGNHEIFANGRGEKLYREQFHLPEGKTHYAFRAGGVLFVILDSETGKGRILNDQLSWLVETLSSSEERFKLVFIHRPLFVPMDSLKRGRVMDRYPLERDLLHRLFLRTGVKAVFQGDDHRYDRMEKDGILYLITGGGGAPLASLKIRGGFFHYVWISVQQEKVEGEVVDVDGRVRDRFMIE
jgi:3',5'-cyclic AMP phosphodiesterase CpdA